MPGLVIKRKVGQAVVIATVTDKIVVRVEAGKGPTGEVTLRIEAGNEVVIGREELGELRRVCEGGKKQSKAVDHRGTETQRASEQASVPL